jgi:hypothetical protein
MGLAHSAERPRAEQHWAPSTDALWCKQNHACIATGECGLILQGWEVMSIRKIVEDTCLVEYISMYQVTHFDQYVEKTRAHNPHALATGIQLNRWVGVMKLRLHCL